MTSISEASFFDPNRPHPLPEASSSNTVRVPHQALANASGERSMTNVVVVQKEGNLISHAVGDVLYGVESEAMEAVSQMLPQEQLQEILSQLPITFFQGCSRALCSVLQRIPLEERGLFLRITYRLTTSSSFSEKMILFQKITQLSHHARMRFFLIAQHLLLHHELHPYGVCAMEKSPLMKQLEEVMIAHADRMQPMMQILEESWHPSIYRQLILEFFEFLRGEETHLQIFNACDFSVRHAIVQVLTKELSHVMQTSPLLFVDLVSSTEIVKEEKENQEEDTACFCVVLNARLLFTEPCELDRQLMRYLGCDEEQARILAEHLFYEASQPRFSYEIFCAMYALSALSITALESAVSCILEEFYHRSHTVLDDIHTLRKKGYGVVLFAARDLAYVDALNRVYHCVDQVFCYDERNTSFETFIRRIRGTLPFFSHELVWITCDRRESHLLQAGGAQALYCEQSVDLQEHLKARGML